MVAATGDLEAWGHRKRLTVHKVYMLSVCTHKRESRYNCVVIDEDVVAIRC